MHVRDLNFVLRSEIVVHTDGQHRASHLIHNCDLVYFTWQSFIQALLWIAYFYHTSTFETNFLSPSLTIGEARDLSPRYTTTEDLAPVRDESVEHMSQSRKVHVPIEQLEAQA